MTSAGDRIKAACKEAVDRGSVDEEGRPLTVFVAMQALGRPFASFPQGKQRGIEEQIDLWWEEHDA